MIKEFNKNGEFVKFTTFKDLLQENYFVSKSINIIYKKRLATGFNIKESDNYYFEFIASSRFGDEYKISPIFYFKLDLKDTSENLEKIGLKIRDSLEFKELIKYNEELRQSKKDISLNNFLACKYLKNQITVNFKKC